MFWKKRLNTLILLITNSIMLKSSLIVFSFFAYVSTLFAGDTACNSTSLNTDMLQFEQVTIGVSGSAVDDPTCGDFHGADEWFSFTAPTGGDVAIQLLEGSITNAAFALYSGTCSSLEEIHCVNDYLCGTEQMPAWFFEDLEPGATYYLRIWNEDGPIPGTVQLRIAHPSGNPYVTTGSATNIAFEGYSNCIQLTAAQFNQAGCAWYPEQVDFSQAFEHSFNLYLGDIQGQAGADGMAIIYQINGIPICGIAGGGIGYMGIPNSWAIEFDTYYNDPPFIDLVEDHTAISINGDLYFHPSGPVGLGFISDGEFHDVIVSWEPASQLFRVWFDGELVHDLNYDIINEVFGGETMVWWGVSASTGGAFNQHVLCFDNLEIENLVNVQTTVEMTVCENEPVFLAGDFQTEPGLYFDYYPAFNGCDSIVATHLMHHPTYDPVILEEVICPGDTYLFHGIPVSESGIYEAYLTDQFGCDSLVILEATVPFIEVYLEDNGPLTCAREIVTIEALIETDADDVIIDWVSFGGNIISGNGTTSIEVNQAGVYVAEVFFEKNGIFCGPHTYEIQIEEFHIYPFGEIEVTGELGCSEETVILDGSSSQNADDYNWSTNEGNIIDQSQPWLIEVDAPGIYQLDLINSFSSCTTTIEIEVDPPPGAPIAAIVVLDTASCGNPITILSAEGSSVSNDITYLWTVDNGEIISDSTIFEFEVLNGDIVYLTVTDTTNNCQSTASLVLPFDNSFPHFTLHSSGELNCSVDEVEITLDIQGEFSGDLFFQWYDEDGFVKSDTGQSFLLTENPGWYYLEISEITERCIFQDSIEVLSNFETPEVSLIDPDDMDCLTDTLFLEAVVSIPDSVLNYHWQGPEDGFVEDGDGQQILLFEPGHYILEVVHQISHCSSADSIVINDLRELPEFEMPDSIVLNCLYRNILIEPEIIYPTDESDLNFQWFEAGDAQPFSLEKPQWFTNPGNYRFTVLNESNYCESTAYLYVGIDTLSPEIELIAPDLLNCENQTDRISVNELSQAENINFSWFDSDMTELQSGNSSDLEVSSSGWYYVYAENLINACAASDSILVEEDFSIPAGNLSIDPEHINCLNPEVELTFEPDILIDSLSLQWSFPDGSTVNQEHLPYSIYSGVGGWIQLEVTHPISKCTFTQEIEISAFLNQPIIDLDLSAEVLTCDIENVNALFEVEGNIDDLIVDFIDSEGVQTTFFSGMGEFLITEPDVFQIIATDTLSWCTDTLEFEITQNREFPQIDLVPFEHLSCRNTETTLQIEGDFDNIEVEIEWFKNGESISSDASFLAENPGVFEVLVKNSENGCISRINLELDYLGTPITSIELSKFEVDCEGENGAIFIENIEGGTHPINLFVNNEQVEVNEKIDSLPSGEYELQWIDSLGCQWTEKLILEEPVQLKGDIPPLYQVDEGDAVELRTEINKDESELVSIVWEPELFLDCSWCLYPMSRPEYSLDYQLWIKDRIGCELLLTTRVELNIRRDVYIPNAFSPGNRDGLNDYFFPLSREGRIAEINLFQVFDRWGEKVFSVENIPPDKEENGWDGTFSGELVNPAVFIYLIKIEWVDGETSLHSGEINLIH